MIGRRAVHGGNDCHIIGVLPGEQGDAADHRENNQDCHGHL